MDKELINDILTEMTYLDKFQSSEIHAATVQLYRPPQNFEELLFKFTCAFLAHPNMLKQFSYEEIIKKAYEFTKTYVEYVPNN